MIVERTDFVSVPVTDMERATVFYRDTLGLPQVSEDGFPEFQRRELEEKGVAFEGEVHDSGVCHMAFFRDPDGNQFMLHRRYAPREP